MDSAHRQQRPVEDLLLISRLELGALSVSMAVFRVGHLVSTAAEEVRANYRDQRIDLRGLNDLWARADGELVTQIVVNLTDNAAKYSPENAPVEIEWSAEEPPSRESMNPCA